MIIEANRPTRRTVADRPGGWARRIAACGLALGIAGGPLMGCGGEDGPAAAATVAGETMAIYSSQPLVGRMAPQGIDVVRGERLALREAGGRVGRFAIVSIARNNADPAANAVTWDPALVLANARRAAKDPRTVAYLGELDTGASAISIPVLNEEEILQVSPADTVAGLTTRRGAAGSGEPDKYYPTRRRTFARLMPPDSVQAAALLETMRRDGVGRLLILNDDAFYGKSLAVRVELTATRAGITVVDDREMDADRSDPDPESIASVAGDAVQAATEGGADAVLAAGDWSGTAALLRAIHLRAPLLRLYAPGALAGDPTFPAALGGATSAVTQMTYAPLPPRLRPPAAVDFVRRFRRAYGADPQPYAVYGYEAMRGVLAAIRAAGDGASNRRAVVRAFFDARPRSSPIGIYRILPSGDTTEAVYGVYRPQAAGLVFEQRLGSLSLGR